MALNYAHWRSTASSGMRHIASSCTSYKHVYLATCGCRCSQVGLRRAPDLPAKVRKWLRETRICRAKASLHGTPGPIVSSSDCLCSLGPGKETNNPLKSGPAKAGPAGPAMLPLLDQADWLTDEHNQILHPFAHACVLANSVIWLLWLPLTKSWVDLYDYDVNTFHAAFIFILLLFVFYDHITSRAMILLTVL